MNHIITGMFFVLACAIGAMVSSKKWTLALICVVGWLALLFGQTETLGRTVATFFSGDPGFVMIFGSILAGLVFAILEMLPTIQKMALATFKFFTIWIIGGAVFFALMIGTDYATAIRPVTSVWALATTPNITISIVVGLVLAVGYLVVQPRGGT